MHSRSELCEVIEYDDDSCIECDVCKEEIVAEIYDLPGVIVRVGEADRLAYFCHECYEKIRERFH